MEHRKACLFCVLIHKFCVRCSHYCWHPSIPYCLHCWPLVWCMGYYRTIKSICIWTFNGTRINRSSRAEVGLNESIDVMMNRRESWETWNSVFHSEKFVLPMHYYGFTVTLPLVRELDKSVRSSSNVNNNPNYEYLFLGYNTASFLDTRCQ